MIWQRAGNGRVVDWIIKELIIGQHGETRIKERGLLSRTSKSATTGLDTKADTRSKNVARAWTNETAVMCGRELAEDLPYNQ